MKVSALERISFLVLGVSACEPFSLAEGFFAVEQVSVFSVLDEQLVWARVF